MTDQDTPPADTVRGPRVDAVRRAEPGHAATPPGTGPVASALWQGYAPLRELQGRDPHHPVRPDRDPFLLSGERASAPPRPLPYRPAGTSPAGRRVPETVA
ncbi:hypothetical protein [Streptomyces malaysiense]|uniref:Transketolase N-terminal domain-containing protein n=1 Tax=Streptomyces malaysiense TaxID=1428626 RepID=A0A1J4PX93_9ACTN|nr:hypothetical protein [Streptomyces malaysiense]OIK24440.1 hypothetical protein VT52_027250 [Streptomyces malaysiense]